MLKPNLVYTHIGHHCIPLLQHITASGEIQHGIGRHLEFSSFDWFGLSGRNCFYPIRHSKRSQMLKCFKIQDDSNCILGLKGLGPSQECSRMYKPNSVRRRKTSFYTIHDALLPIKFNMAAVAMVMYR